MMTDRDPMKRGIGYFDLGFPCIPPEGYTQDEQKEFVLAYEAARHDFNKVQEAQEKRFKQLLGPAHAGH